MSGADAGPGATDFDVDPDLFADEGDLDEDAAEAYERELFRRFEESPEGRALAAAGTELGSVRSVIRYGLQYQGVTPARMTAAQLEEILFDIIPRKVMCEPEEAEAIVDETAAFFRFLAREHRLASALRCGKLVAEARAPSRLRRALADSTKWGMAKSLVMEGKQQGYDVGSKEGLAAWFAAHNASVGAPPPASPEVDRRTARRSAADRRNKRKAQRKARRRNRS